MSSHQKAIKAKAHKAQRQTVEKRKAATAGQPRIKRMSVPIGIAHRVQSTLPVVTTKTLRSGTQMKNIRHTEVISGTVSSGVTFNAVGYFNNPRNVTSYPWLAQSEALGWEKWRFNSLTIRFLSAAPTSVAGQVIVCYDPKGSDATPTSVPDSMSWKNSIVGSIYQDLELSISRDDLQAFGPKAEQYAAVSTNSEPTQILECAGSFFVAFNGVAINNGGLIQVTYDVDFFSTELDTDSIFSIVLPNYTYGIQGTAGVDKTHALGTSCTINNYTNLTTAWYDSIFSQLLLVGANTVQFFEEWTGLISIEATGVNAAMTAAKTGVGTLYTVFNIGNAAITAVAALYLWLGAAPTTASYITFDGSGSTSISGANFNFAPASGSQIITMHEQGRIKLSDADLAKMRRKVAFFTGQPASSRNERVFDSVLNQYVSTSRCPQESKTLDLSPLRPDLLSTNSRLTIESFRGPLRSTTAGGKPSVLCFQGTDPVLESEEKSSTSSTLSSLATRSSGAPSTDQFSESEWIAVDRERATQHTTALERLSSKLSYEDLQTLGDIITRPKHLCKGDGIK